MKKFVLIGFISLYGASLFGLDVRQQAKRLLKVALTSDADAQKFSDFAVTHLIDIDTMLFSKRQTHTKFIDTRLHNSTVDIFLTQRTARILSAVERLRSNPPHADKLRDLIKEILDEADSTKLAAQLALLKSVVLGNNLNIDRIPYDLAAPKITLGKALDDFRRDINAKDKASRARAILLLHDIRRPRTKSETKFDRLRNLVIDALVDDTTFDTLKKNYNRIDVDTVLMANDESILATSKTQPKAKTIGDELDTRSADPQTRKILGFLRPYRKKEMDKFVELLNAYKKDATKLTDLKKWFEEYPFDIDSFSPWDPKQKQKTFGQQINALQDPILTDLFKASRSNIVPKYAQEIVDREANAYFWKKVLFTTAVVGGGLLYYWSATQKSEQSAKTEQPLAG